MFLAALKPFDTFYFFHTYIVYSGPYSAKCVAYIFFRMIRCAFTRGRVLELINIFVNKHIPTSKKVRTWDKIHQRSLYCDNNIKSYLIWFKQGMLNASTSDLQVLAPRHLPGSPVSVICCPSANRPKYTEGYSYRETQRTDRGREVRTDWTGQVRRIDILNNIVMIIKF